MAAIAKALYAQTTNIYTPPEPPVPLNTFYPVPRHRIVYVGIIYGFFALFGHTSDQQLPRMLMPIRQSIITRAVAGKIFKGLVYTHIAEASLALVTCLRRGWYDSTNTFKWTFSTLIYGMGSLGLLRKHARDVQGI
ncbi:hypothetical protein BC941DRAFT_48527 [Chlamydoabsidia padenii]|nr:hypothetical protein BC941DRAFT_48527 [Chlamydoabsidia padenii]